MVVRLILEIDEPLFLHPVHIDRDHDGACVNFVGLFLIVQLALRLQLLDAERCQIPEGYIFVIASLIHFVAVREIHLKCILQRLPHIAFFEVDLFQLCLECRVTAMIGPVCIEHTDLRDGRISLLLVPIVLADEQEVLVCHGQIQRVVEYLKIIQRHGSEALEFSDICRFRIIRSQCFRLHLIGDAGVYRIDAVVLDFCKIFIGNITDDHICGSGVNSRRFLLIEETDALLGGVGSLIELSGQIFYREDTICALSFRKLLFVEIIYRRFCENRSRSFLIGLICYVLNIITNEYANILNPLNMQVVLCLMQ